MATPLVKHVSAVLKMPKQAKTVAAFATNIVTNMTNNANFPAPSPSLATIDGDIAAFAAAESAVLNRTKGAAETRDVKLAALKTDLGHVMAYVQQVADTNPATAEAVIQSAGMAVRKVGSHTKSDLEAEPGDVSGSAKLIAKAAGPRAAYEWQYSIDQKTWTNAPSSLQAKTVISGLTPATVYYFRVKPVTKTGEGNWSQVVSLLQK